MEEDKSKIRDTTGTVFIQAPSILLLVWRSIMFNGSFLIVCRILQFVKKKIRFCLLESGQTKPWCPGLVSRPSAKHRNHWQELEDLLFSPQKLLVGAYFEILFLGCGFLIHLSNRSDSPRFPAPWKKIRQKYGHNRNRLYSRAIHCPASLEMHYVQWFLLKSVYEITDCAKN